MSDPAVVEGFRAVHSKLEDMAQVLHDHRADIIDLSLRVQALETENSSLQARFLQAERLHDTQIRTLKQEIRTLHKVFSGNSHS